MQKFLVVSLFLVLLLSAAESWALPPCPGSYYQDTWTNCQGTFTWADGDKYVGEFKDDKQNGQGTHTFADGSKYVGEWKDGLPNGQGTHTFADGSKYVGEYKVGLRHGQGTYTDADADGNAQEGIWEDGEYVYSLVSATNNKKGNQYRDGYGVVQCCNYKEALKWYLLSAEEGNKDAMLNIARLYQAEKIDLWHEKTILELWDETMQSTISELWNETDSTSPRSMRIKAYMWANLAGDDLRYEIAESLTAAELEEAQMLSSACLKKKYKKC